MRIANLEYSSEQFRVPLQPVSDPSRIARAAQCKGTALACIVPTLFTMRLWLATVAFSLSFARAGERAVTGDQWQVSGLIETLNSNQEGCTSLSVSFQAQGGYIALAFNGARREPRDGGAPNGVPQEARCASSAAPRARCSRS